MQIMKPCSTPLYAVTTNLTSGTQSASWSIEHGSVAPFCLHCISTSINRIKPPKEPGFPEEIQFSYIDTNWMKNELSTNTLSESSFAT